MDSIPKYLASFLTIILGVLMAVSLVLATVVVSSARTYHASVIEEIEAANFEESVINTCIQQAQKDGYTIEIVPQTDPTISPTTFYRVTLGYKMALPLMGHAHQSEITGYALGGARVVLVPEATYPVVVPPDDVAPLTAPLAEDSTEAPTEEQPTESPTEKPVDPIPTENPDPLPDPNLRYKVSIDPAGGLYAGKAEVSLLGELTLDEEKNLEIPTKTGYEFNGWDTNNMSCVITENLYRQGAGECVLTAKWTAKPYHVTYYSNTDPDQVIATDTVLYGQSYTTRPETAFLKPGFKLVGWSSQKNAADPSGSIVPGKTIQWDHDSDVAWYAIWQMDVNPENTAESN